MCCKEVPKLLHYGQHNPHLLLCYCHLYVYMVWAQFACFCISYIVLGLAVTTVMACVAALQTTSACFLSQPVLLVLLCNDWPALPKWRAKWVWVPCCSYFALCVCFSWRMPRWSNSPTWLAKKPSLPGVKCRVLASTIGTQQSAPTSLGAPFWFE